MGFEYGYSLWVSFIISLLFLSVAAFLYSMMGQKSDNLSRISRFEVGVLSSLIGFTFGSNCS